MKKRKNIFLIFSLLFIPLVSCSNSEVDTKVEEVDPDLVKPEQSEKTQFYLKNKLENIKRGMSINLSDYIGVVIGKNETNSEFKSYVLNGDSSLTTGYILEGDGAGNTLVCTRVGDCVINVECNNVVKTYVIKIEESDNASEFIEVLNTVDHNYTAESESIGTIYRNRQYIYLENEKNGYILSSKDDNFYSFSLDNKDSNDINVAKAPTGVKETYYNNFIDLNKYADPSYWVYTPLCKDNIELKKYKYQLTYSSTVTSQYFLSLGIVYSSYTINGVSYAPSVILGGIEDGVISFLPVLYSSSLGTYAYLSPITLSNINNTKVEVLNNYIDEYMAPEHYDTTIIVDNLKELDEIRNYTIKPSSKIITPNGNKLSINHPYYTQYFENIATDYERKITYDAYWGRNFSGATIKEPRRGGLYSTNNKTYLFSDKDDDGVYEKVEEYIDYSTQASLTHWWAYTNMQKFVPSLGFTYSNFAKAYPDYDEESKTYTFTSTLTASTNIIKSAISMVSREYLINQGIYKLAFEYNQIELKISFDYNEDNSLKEVNLDIYMTINKNIYTALDGDYTFILNGKITDIGSTNVDEIISSVSFPKE